MHIFDKFQVRANIFRKAMGWRPNIEKPVALQIPINDICNSKCVMCDIWKNKDDNSDFSLDDFRSGLENDLFSQVTSIGINGGEPTLRSELFDIVNIAFEVLPKLKNLSIITNGYQNQIIYKKILTLEKLVYEKGGNLDVMVSLDGIGDVHSEVRGRPGYFNRTSSLIIKLKNDLEHASLRVGCTVVKQNCFHLHDILDFCRKNGVYVKFRLGIEHKRLYNIPKKDDFKLDYLQKLYLIDFLHGIIEHYESSEDQKVFYQSLIDQLNGCSTRSAGCDWQYRGATISSNGEISFCAVKSPAVSNLRSSSIEADYFNGQEELHSIIDNSCESCNHDYTGLPSGSLLRKKIKSKLLNLVGLGALSLQTVHGSFRKKYLSGLPGYIKYHRANPVVPDIQIKKGERIDPPKKILLAGWYGTETLGDKAILYGVMKLLRREATELNFTVLTFNKDISERTLLLTNDGNYTHEIMQYSTVFSQLGSFDAVYFAGGPIMALEELFDIVSVFKCAKKLGLKTGILGCGVGPFGSLWRNLAIKELFKHADEVILRDKGSSQIIKKKKIKSIPTVASDPSCEWLSDYSIARNYSDKIKKLNQQNNEINLGLALRMFPKAEYAPNWSQKETKQYTEKFENAVNEFISILSSKYHKVNIILMPMCTNFIGGDDRFYLRNLVTSVHGNVVVNKRFCCEELPAEEYLSGFGEMDFLLAMRFHSVIFGSQLSVPTLAIDYTLGQGKIKFLAEERQLPYLDYRHVSSRSLIDSFEQCKLTKNQPPKQFNTDFSQAKFTSII